MGCIPKPANTVGDIRRLAADMSSDARVFVRLGGQATKRAVANICIEPLSCNCGKVITDVLVIELPNLGQAFADVTSNLKED